MFTNNNLWPVFWCKLNTRFLQKCATNRSKCTTDIYCCMFAVQLKTKVFTLERKKAYLILTTSCKDTNFIFIKVIIVCFCNFECKGQFYLYWRPNFVDCFEIIFRKLSLFLAKFCRICKSNSAIQPLSSQFTFLGQQPRCQSYRRAPIMQS